MLPKLGVMMPDEAKTGALVLCGGKSQRMGQPKHLLKFGTETLLERVVRVLGEITRTIGVVAADQQSLPKLDEHVVVLRDEQPDLGPLSGLATGLGAFSERTDFVYASSCDAPFLSATFVTRMFELLGDADLVMLKEDKYHHPLAAVYRTRIAPMVRQLVDDRRLRPIFLLEECNARVMSIEDMRDVDPGLLSLKNVNTPEEYQDALRLAGFDHDQVRGAKS